MGANKVERAVGIELCTLTREIALLVQQTSEAVKAVSAPFVQSTAPRAASLRERGMEQAQSA